MDAARLLHDLTNAVHTPTNDVAPGDRAALMAACDKLKQHLESPMEATIRLAFGVRTVIL